MKRSFIEWLAYLKFKQDCIQTGFNAKEITEALKKLTIQINNGNN